MGFPHDVDAHVQGARQVRQAIRRAEQAVLRKCDELQVEIGCDEAADLEQGLDAAQAVVRCVDMATDCKETHRDRPVAVGERAVADFFDGGDPAKLAPERDALQCVSELPPEPQGLPAPRGTGEGRWYLWSHLAHLDYRSLA